MFISKIISIIKQALAINWVKTLYFNFYYLPIKQAIKIPIFVFRHTTLLKISGKIVLNGSARVGQVKIGKHAVGTLDLKYSRTIWENNGTIIFEGKANIGSGVRLSTVTRESMITFGDNFVCTGGSSFICSKSISFGKECLLSWDILIMDTDFHKILNINGEAINDPKPIKVGNKIWIGCRCTILKGVNICNDIVIASGSKITSDITQPNSIIGGTDKQRIIKENITWSV